jgi:hypothetical protein
MRFIICACMLVLLASACTASATYVNIIEPYNATVGNNGSVYLGKVGPGQTFFVTVSASTTNSSGSMMDLGWNKLVVTGIPQGWLAQNSSLYNPTLSAKITVAPNASNGTYVFNLTAINVGNYSGLGHVSFKAYANVTPDVFVLDVHPTSISTGPGEPASIYVQINNTGVSDSPFVISAQDLPGVNSTQTVIALHSTTQQFVYGVYENEPGVYNMKLRVSSLASPRVYKETDIALRVAASLPNDYEALGQGVLAFPIIYEPAYAVMYLISIVARALHA